jgi:hypothetical protein
MQQYSVPPQPQNVPPASQPEQPPAAPPPATQQPKPQPGQESYSARVYEDDNIEIPTFLRKRR